MKWSSRRVASRRIASLPRIRVRVARSVTLTLGVFRGQSQRQRKQRKGPCSHAHNYDGTACRRSKKEAGLSSELTNRRTDRRA